jgi:chemotaxis protein MotA
MGSVSGLSTGLAIILGTMVVIVGIYLTGGSPNSFLSAPSFMVVFLGSLFATIGSFSPRQLIASFKSLKSVFFPTPLPYADTIARLYELAAAARRDGVVGLETQADNIEDPFFARALDIVISTPDPDAAREMLEINIESDKKSQKNNQEVFRRWGSYAPAFGMLGTLIGLILMLGKLDDPSQLGPNMALALITTFYGVLLANMVMFPIASRMTEQLAKEADFREMIINGIIYITQGESPARVADKLEFYVPIDQRAEVRERISALTTGVIGGGEGLEAAD